MNSAHPTQQDLRKPRALRWLSWAVSLLCGGAILVALAVVAVNSLKEGMDATRLAAILSLVLFAALALGLKTRLHPIRARSDTSSLWKERFPTHTEQAIQRFLRVVGEGFGFGARHWSKFRPDDELATIQHQWNGGDGMELVELVMEVEREYSLELPEEFLATDKTLGELFEYVARPPAGQSAANGRRDPPESG